MGHTELQPEDVDESVTPLVAAIKRTWSAFCNTTSIHGLKYTIDEETNKYVRFIWILITFIMFLCAIVMVITFYVDYHSNPTRMNVENDHAPISSIYFPPITICPEVIYNTQKTKHYLETLILPNFTSIPDILDVLDAHSGFMFESYGYDMKALALLENLLALNNLKLLQFIYHMSWSISDIFVKCRYKDEMVDCNDLFQVSSTYRGFCLSFNLNQTTFYSNKQFTKRYAHSGLRNGLSLMLYYNDSNFDRLHTYSHGFRIMIQETNAYPSAHSSIKFIPLNEEVFIAIRPTETFCSQAVKNLAFKDRQCVFPYEEKLTFFHTYCGANCELNCRINMMLKYCNCYTYFFFNNKTDNPLCTYKDIPCLVDNFGKIVGRDRSTQCNCYKSCEKIKYDVQVSSAPLDLDIPTVDSFYDGLQKDYSVVHVYLNSQVFRRVRHDLLSNMVTLVSNLGSAFSLFVGMSMVSAVEILYYFSIILRKYYQQEYQARHVLFERRIQNKTVPEIPEELEKSKDVEKENIEAVLEDIFN